MRGEYHFLHITLHTIGQMTMGFEIYQLSLLRVAIAQAQHAGWTVFGHETLFGVVLSYS
jgi:hypothetical protein